MRRPKIGLLTRAMCVGYVGVVCAVSVLLDGVRGAKNVENGAGRGGSEPVHVPPGGRVEDGGVAWRCEDIVHHQFR
jgi:hypothetical protein